jgi:glyoxylase-like metal-dependent hydrolase (beta-lactamase superfamily II)
MATSLTCSHFVHRLPHDIHVVDTGFARERFTASFIVRANGRAAFVDTGTNNSVPRLLAALDDLGIERDCVDYVILTHVHLDHAGGAGLLMQQLPKARLVVHPRGARHMIHPSKLMAGVKAVYGEEVAARDYGELVPVPADRVMETYDQMVLDLAGRPLLFADTPGHALHHDCIWDAASRGWFTGDTFGIAYPEFTTEEGAQIIPATAPVQFDPEQLRASIERLLSFEPQVVYLTHFGAVDRPRRIAEQLLAQIDAMVSVARTLADHPQRHDALKQAFREIYVGALRAHGCRLSDRELDEILEVDLELNAQGVGVWLEKRLKAEG